MIDLAHRLARLSSSRLQLLKQQLEQAVPVAEPIAIIGLGCRFPGAADLEAFWQLISTGERAISQLPADRWQHQQIAEAAGANGAAADSGRYGGFVDSIDQFDAAFFGIAPREAAKMDPQQRLLMEVTWRALEHAGLAPERLSGSATGVFVGIGAADYAKLPFTFDDYYGQIDAHSGTGNALSIAANRMSYFFDWHGPSMSVDTACSSALVALHLAVKNLQNREADLAVAGGVNLMLSPEATLAFSKAGMLSPDGHCRPFDARANGYVRGEGAGIVVLKRLSDAIADGDRVLATIRGTAVNQDGRTSGMTAPNSQSQESVIRTALRQAGLEADAISYVEAHGTGTPLGDPIELEALRQVFQQQSRTSEPCYVSSVKANIGHLETAAGIASVIKVVLMMQRGQITPQSDFHELNPHISLDGQRLQIPRQLTPWQPASQPRRAGISSFGFGGTNAHVILEHAAPVVPPPERPSAPVKVLAVSAKSPAALTTLAEQYAEYLDVHPEVDLDAFCHAANSGRSHFHYGRTFTAGDTSQLRRKLSEFAASDSADGQRRGFHAPKVAFVFTGQGGQYAGMGRELFETQPLFRETLQQCDAILQEPLQASILELMHDSAAAERLAQTAYTQPALFAIEYSLAQLWRSLGIEPVALLGHSVGEFVAATLAGVFSLEDGLRLIAERGRLMQQCSGDGAMAAVAAAGEVIERMLRGRDGRVEIAALNGPSNTVISGDRKAVEQIVEVCREQGLKAKFLPVSHAFHSPQMDQVLEQFKRFAAAIPAQAPRVPMISNLTGDWLTDAPDGAYWREHLRRTVRFEAGLRKLVEEQPDFVLEAGPSPTLLAMGRQCIDRPELGWLPSLRGGQSDWQVLASSLGELYGRGARIRWANLYGQPAPAKLELPGYPFERKRHWYEETGRQSTPSRGHSSPAKRGDRHPLLGGELATTLKTRLFETHIEEHAPAYLTEHRVQGSAVTPAAAYLEQALAAADALFGPGTHAISDVSIQQAMFLPAGSPRQMQFTTSEDPTDRCSFRIHSRSADSSDRDAWVLHAHGTLARGAATEASPAAAEATEAEKHVASATHAASSNGVAVVANGKPAGVWYRPARTDQGGLAERLVTVLEGEQFYERMSQIGLQYGPRFRVVRCLRRGDDEVLAELDIPVAVREESASHRIHPAILDGCLQAMAGLVPLAADGSPSSRLYLPTGIGHFRLLDDPLRATRIYVRRNESQARSPLETIHGDVALLNAEGQLIAELRDVRIQSLGATAARPRDNRDWLYHVRWESLSSIDGAAANGSPVGAGAAFPSDAARRWENTHWIVVADAVGISEQLVERIRRGGGRCLLVHPGDGFAQLDADTFQIDPLQADQYERVFDALRAESGVCDGVLHLSSIGLEVDAPTAARDVWGGALQLLQQAARGRLRTTPPVWLCTQGAQGVAAADQVCPLQSTLWGLGRTAALELPGLSLRLLDLDPAAEAARSADALLGELAAGSDEDQLAIRGDDRYAARLVPAKAAADAQEAGRRSELAVPAEPFRLRSREAGSFDDLEYVRFQPPALGSDQVSIEVHAAGLNFSDVLKAMGLYPGLNDQEPPLGIECSGVVTAVGAEVTRFRVGDAVMGVAPSSFGSHAVTAEYALAHKPESLSHDEASTVPITFMTAHYALRWLARLGRGERVLIHAAAGGVGQAAIQIAEHVGAEVFATAGSDEKRGFLASLGVAHVYNSRTVAFADQIRQATGGQGVDVVLNSLPGDAIPKSLSILGAYGRFLEIGKTDIYQDRMIGLAPFQDNLSYFAIDLDRMLRQRPDDIRRLMGEVMELFEQGVYHALPHKTFPAAETATAFRYMAQRKNIGKVVVSLAPHSRPAAPRAERDQPVRCDASYLITGGLGALGLRLARWLIEAGAEHLVLVSRRPPTEDQHRALQDLPSRAKVVCVQGDVADRAALEAALAQIPAGFPAIRGVLHAAGALADGLLYDMTLDQFERALRPKVQGAWNLHTVSQAWPLDFFVMFSSVAAVLGSPGQANYSAGNAFLDGLAAHRRTQGLPASAINWGPWAEGGMATTADPQSQLSGRGMQLLAPHDCLEILGRLLQDEDATQVAVMDVDWSALARQFPRRRPPLFAAFAEQWSDSTAGGDSGKLDREFLASFARAESRSQLQMLQSYLTDELARIMGIEPEELDPDQLLNVVGVDSLMAMELKTNLESQLGIELPMSALMEHPSIASLAAVMHASLSGHSETPKEAGANSTAAELAPEAPRGSSLIPLQTQGAMPALFCLHPVGGDLRCYRQLAQHLGQHRCVTTIRPRGAEAGSMPHETVEEMAEEYCGLMRGVQPHGPYLLAGWSTGGIFAYEVARQLRASGQAVELLFIDTPTAAILDHVDLQDDARFLYDLVNFSNWFSGARMRIEYAELKTMEPDEATDRILREMKQERVLPDGTTRADLQRRIELCRAHLRAALAYRIQPLGQRVRMYRPKQSAVLSLATGRQLGDDLGWRPILGDDLEIEQVSGDHFSMLTGRHGEQLADIIRQHLDSIAPPDAFALNTSRSVLL